jgi:hypothetical protein
MAHEIALAIAGDAVAQNEIVHAAADIDRIDLHTAEVTQRGGEVGQGRIEMLHPAEKAPCGEWSDREGRRHARQ